MSVQTLINRLRGLRSRTHKVALDPVWNAFFEEVKRAHEVTDSEALEAADRLTKKRKGFAEGWSAGGARGFLKDIISGNFGKNVTKGAVTSALRSGVQDVAQTLKDHRTVKSYIQQSGGPRG
jgi:hypothetical protein